MYISLDHGHLSPELYTTQSYFKSCSQLLTPYAEAKVLLAIFDLQRAQTKSVRLAEKVYKVPRTTIRRRRDGTRPRHDCQPNSKRLTKLEEEAIVKRLLEESLCGIPPS
jgi:hypothetical protein